MDLQDVACHSCLISVSQQAECEPNNQGFHHTLSKPHLTHPWRRCLHYCSLLVFLLTTTDVRQDCAEAMYRRSGVTAIRKPLAPPGELESHRPHCSPSLGKQRMRLVSYADCRRSKIQRWCKSCSVYKSPVVAVSEEFYHTQLRTILHRLLYQPS